MCASRTLRAMPMCSLRGKEGSAQVHLLTQQLRERARLFFAALPHDGEGRHPFSNREEFLESCGDLYVAVSTSLKLLEAEFERLSETDEAPGLESRSAALARRPCNTCWKPRPPTWCSGWSGGVLPRIPTESLLHALAGARTTFMQATPIDVSEISAQPGVGPVAHGRAHVGHAHGAGRLRASTQAARPGRSQPGGARARGALALPLRKAGAALSAAADARSARGGVPGSRGR